MPPKSSINRGNQDRIKQFVNLYFYGKNGTRFNAVQSALEAGYSKGFANSRAHELVGDDRSKARNKGLFDAIKREREKIISKTTISREDLLAGYQRELDLDIGDMIDEAGNFKNPKDLPEDIRKSIYGIEITTKGIKYKLPNKRANRQDIINWIYTERKDDSQSVNVNLQWAVFPAQPQSLEDWQQQTQAILHKHQEATPVTLPPPAPGTPADTTTYSVPQTDEESENIND